MMNKRAELETPATNEAEKPLPLSPILLRTNEVCRILGICRNSLIKLENSDPTFPRPLKIFNQDKRYLREKVEQWARNRQFAECKSGS